jgi:hypothetical protein
MNDGRTHEPISRPTTTPAKVIKSLCFGALAGAALVAGGFGVLFVLAGSLAYLPLLLLAFPIALAGWAIGLGVVATPGWWVLHTLGARSQSAGMAYGGGLCALVALAVSLFLPLSFAPANEGYKILATPITEAGWDGVAPGILLFAAMGVLVGWVVNRVAYAKPNSIQT